MRDRKESRGEARGRTATCKADRAAPSSSTACIASDPPAATTSDERPRGDDSNRTGSKRTDFLCLREGNPREPIPSGIGSELKNPANPGPEVRAARGRPTTDAGRSDHTHTYAGRMPGVGRRQFVKHLRSAQAPAIWLPGYFVAYLPCEITPSPIGRGKLNHRRHGHDTTSAPRIPTPWCRAPADDDH